MKYLFVIFLSFFICSLFADPDPKHVNKVFPPHNEYYSDYIDGYLFTTISYSQNKCKTVNDCEWVDPMWFEKYIIVTKPKKKDGYLKNSWFLDEKIYVGKGDHIWTHVGLQEIIKVGEENYVTIATLGPRVNQIQIFVTSPDFKYLGEVTYFGSSHWDPPQYIEDGVIVFEYPDDFCTGSKNISMANMPWQTTKYKFTPDRLEKKIIEKAQCP